MTAITTDAFILCELAGATYAIASNLVHHVEMIDHITPVPNVPAYVEGVVFSRGKVIPALNVRERFGFNKKPHDIRTRLIVVEINERTVGLIVDTAREFTVIPADSIRPAPEGIDKLSGDYLAGIATLGERLVLILKPDETFTIADSLETSSLAHSIEENEQ